MGDFAVGKKQFQIMYTTIKSLQESSRHHNHSKSERFYKAGKTPKTFKTMVCPPKAQ